jgi:hypothetical protein
MARKSVQDAVTKWQQRVQQSGPYYQAGVTNPNVDWAGPAVAAADRRNAGLQKAIADGRIDAGIQRAGTAKWRQGAVSKGVTAWTTNTPKAAPAYNAGLQKVYGFFNAADQAVANMPRTTREDRIARAATFLRTVGMQADAAKATA